MTRTKAITFLAGATALVVAALAAGCGSSGGSNANSPAPPQNASGQSATLGVANEDVGKILVDSQGRTLYLFEHDSGTKSTCTGACAVEWPPLRATGKPTVGDGANASVVATSARADGKPQVTYNGHPLYLFSADQKAGDTNGQGVNAFGGLWYVVSSSGDEITTPAGSGGGLGY
jgi:predicted lipoprotein with Yx(FWY)xxD motif